jgi:hypothetical protein
MSSEAVPPGNTPDLNRTDTPRESLWSVLRQLKSPTVRGWEWLHSLVFGSGAYHCVWNSPTDSNVQLISAILLLDLSRYLCPR